MGMDLDVSAGYGILVSGSLDYDDEIRLRERLLEFTNEDLSDGYGLDDILQSILSPYHTLSYAVGRFADTLSGAAIFIDRLAYSESWDAFTLDAVLAPFDEENYELLDIANKLGFTPDDFQIVVIPSYW